MKKWLVAMVAAALAAGALAFDEIPVYGGAKVGYEDAELLENTILEEGTLVVTPYEPWRVFIGDGVTPGGLEVHPKGCVTNFAQVASATTNLQMHSYSITFGPWQMHGDAGEFDIAYGDDENWLRFVRDTGLVYLDYDFTIVDSSHYKFQLAWSEPGYDFPQLQVSPNLTQGYQTVGVDDVVYSRPDSSHLEILYTVPEELAGYVFLGFRLYHASRLSTGAYFGVPVKAEKGLDVTGNLTIGGYDESYYDEHAEENRDRHVDGTLTLNGQTWTNFPDLSGLATAADLGTVSGEVAGAVARIGTLETNAATHATRDWTAAYVATNHQSLDGYATEEWVGEQGFLTDHQSLADYALTSWTIGYVATNHQSLAGYATESWVGEQGFLTEHQSLAGLASESWVSDYVATNHQSLAGLASESWVEGYVATNHQSLAGLASETWVEGYVSTNHQDLSGYATEAWTEAYISTNHQDLSGYATTSAVASVSDRVGAIEADYVQADDIAGFATTSTVASVERRVGRLEGSVCAIFWGTNYMSQSDTTYYIPTNFPTAKLRVVLTDNIVTNVTVTTPKNWEPDRDVEIEILPISNSTRIGNRSIRFTIADSSSEGQTLTTTTTYRKYFYTYFRDGNYWQFWCDSGGQFPWQFTTAGGRTSTLSTWRGPETVEAWLALHPEWSTP